MPEFVLDHGTPEAARRFEELDAFTQAYVQAAFFTDTGFPENEDLESATFAELATEALEEIKKDCAAFKASIRKTWIAAQRDGATASEAQAGHDFWLTRNGHGAGFWDRPAGYYAGRGDYFSHAARAFGEVSLCRGDDGKIYMM